MGDVSDMKTVLRDMKAALPVSCSLVPCEVLPRIGGDMASREQHRSDGEVTMWPESQVCSDGE